MKALSLLAFLGLCLSSHGKSAPIVDLGYASYQGSLDSLNNVTSFIGVRYAAPPTGSLRFAAPAPPATTPGVQQADTPANACFQSVGGAAPTDPFANLSSVMRKRQSSTPAQSEDCLFLSVYVPGTASALDTSAKLPVVVWIHGGGFVNGFAEQFDGTDLLQDADGGVVVVIIQYRLGLLGWLAGKEMKEHGVLNAGLLDQRLALKWVQANVAKFGGNPDMVTIWGESAGANSVVQHIVADHGNTQPPLFLRAMTSSAAMHSQYKFDDPISEAVFSEVVSATNCTTASNAVACLRGVSADSLQDINNAIEVAGFFGLFTFGPVFGGDALIPERPAVLLSRGKVNGDRILSVGNTFEGAIFVSADTVASTNLTAYTMNLLPKLTPEHVHQAVELYTTGNTAVDAPLLNISIGIFGESLYICPTYHIMNAFPGKAFKGLFAVPPGHHAMDLAYYFDAPSPFGGAPPAFNSTAFQKAFSQGFMSFVKFGDPNVKIDPAHPSITPAWAVHSDNNTEMLFNSTDGTAPGSQPDVRAIQTNAAFLERCAFWLSVSEEIPQ